MLAERELEPSPLPPPAISCVEAFGSDGPEYANKYYRARYYDPKIGRFLSEDPIGLAGGVNRYEYVGGNPVGRVDPSGLDWINVTVISVIRPNDPQAGIKTMQSLTVDTETGQVVGREFNLIGKTRVPFLGERQGDGGFNRSVSGGNGCVDIRMGGRAKPFVFDMLGLPLEIDYQIGLRYDEKTGRAEVYGITDSYPSYEIYLNGQKVYDRQQTGWLGGLYGSANDNYFRFSVP